METSFFYFDKHKNKLTSKINFDIIYLDKYRNKKERWHNEKLSTFPKQTQK